MVTVYVEVILQCKTWFRFECNSTPWRDELGFIQIHGFITNVHILFKNLNTFRPSHFKKQGGPSAGSSFEQISMRRLTGVSSPISGGTGWVGSRWAKIWKPYPKQFLKHHHQRSLGLVSYKPNFIDMPYGIWETIKPRKGRIHWVAGGNGGIRTLDEALHPILP